MAILMNNGKPVIANGKLVKGEVAVVGYNLTVSFIDGPNGRGFGTLTIVSNGISTTSSIDDIANPANFTNVTSITIMSEGYGANDYFKYQFNGGEVIELEGYQEEATLAVTKNSTLLLDTEAD